MNGVNSSNGVVSFCFYYFTWLSCAASNECFIFAICFNTFCLLVPFLRVEGKGNRRELYKLREYWNQNVLFLYICSLQIDMHVLVMLSEKPLACFCILCSLALRLLKRSLAGGCVWELSVLIVLTVTEMVFLSVLGGPQSHISPSKMAEFF